MITLRDYPGTSGLSLTLVIWNFTWQVGTTWVFVPWKNGVRWVGNNMRVTKIILVNYSLQCDIVLSSMICEDFLKALMIYEVFWIADGIPVTIHFLKIVIQSAAFRKLVVFPVSRESEDTAWVFKRVEMQSLVLSWWVSRRGLMTEVMLFKSPRRLLVSCRQTYF